MRWAVSWVSTVVQVYARCYDVVSYLSGGPAVHMHGKCYDVSSLGGGLYNFATEVMIDVVLSPVFVW
jgi:hypothetical protein